MIRLSRLDRKNPSWKDWPNFMRSVKFCGLFRGNCAWPWRAAARTNFASEKIVHERQAARAMMTFCFINAASRYHDSPVKQRAVHKDSKGGIAHHGRFPPLPMKLIYTEHKKLYYFSFFTISLYHLFLLCIFALAFCIECNYISKKRSVMLDLL